MPLEAAAYEAYLAGRKKEHVVAPGTSEHGNGLALDFTDGAIIGRDDPERQWLQDNASRFGGTPSRTRRGNGSSEELVLVDVWSRATGTSAGRARATPRTPAVTLRGMRRSSVLGLSTQGPSGFVPSTAGYAGPVPTFRPDVRDIRPYEPGRPIEDVALEFGFDPDDVIKLASNESPLPPIPAVRTAMAEMIDTVHRYPDNEGRALRESLAERLGVRFGEVMIGAGSSELLRVVAAACGGPGTSAVYAWPSFVVYRLGSIMAMSDRIEVPLDSHLRHDLDAMLAAIRPDTTVVYLCNPNNPSGTIVTTQELADFVEAIPERVLVLIDEAYEEFVTDSDHSTALPLAIERRNVMVVRTFSKVHGLASLRVGYGVSNASTITELRKAQAPFTVSALGHAAALESLRHPDEIAQRIGENAAGREFLEQGLADLGIEFVPSQANFVYFRTKGSTESVTSAFLRHAIILRPFGDGWVRVSVGTPDENRRFLEALAEERESLR